MPEAGVEIGILGKVKNSRSQESENSRIRDELPISRRVCCIAPILEFLNSWLLEFLTLEWPASTSPAQKLPCTFRPRVSMQRIDGKRVLHGDLLELVKSTAVTAVARTHIRFQ